MATTSGRFAAPRAAGRRHLRRDRRSDLSLVMTCRTLARRRERSPAGGTSLLQGLSAAEPEFVDGKVCATHRAVLGGLCHVYHLGVWGQETGLVTLPLVRIRESVHQGDLFARSGPLVLPEEGEKHGRSSGQVDPSSRRRFPAYAASGVS